MSVLRRPVNTVKKKDFKTNVCTVKENVRCKWRVKLIKEISFRKTE